MKQDDVEDDNDSGNEMSFWCQACQTARMACNTFLAKMIREGMGHALAVPDTGNGTA